MGRLFDFDGPFFSFFEKIADTVILNIIFIICCLPVFTIGASLTALSSVTQKMVRKEEGYILRGFFSSFKQNFIQATAIWLIMVFFGVVFFFDIRFIAVSGEGVMLNVFRVLLLMLGIIYVFEFIYVFPVLARFDNTILNTMRNALLLSVINLPWTLVLVLLFAVPPVIGYFYLKIGIPLYLFAGFSLVSLISSYIFRKIFDLLVTNG
ncbi:MAG: DUF624 domain-containing protein [Lachnospiraceae bacterium]|nr:DUF624 domain-containing protein [Lachnospiraceae bacterium]